MSIHLHFSAQPSDDDDKMVVPASDTRYTDSRLGPAWRLPRHWGADQESGDRLPDRLLLTDRHDGKYSYSVECYRDLVLRCHCNRREQSPSRRPNAMRNINVLDDDTDRQENSRNFNEVRLSREARERQICQKIFSDRFFNFYLSVNVPTIAQIELRESSQESEETRASEEEENEERKGQLVLALVLALALVVATGRWHGVARLAPLLRAPLSLVIQLCG